MEMSQFSRRNSVYKNIDRNNTLGLSVKHLKHVYQIGGKLNGL